MRPAQRFNFRVSSPIGVALSSNGARLVASSEDGCIRIWDLSSDEAAATGFRISSTVRSIDVASDGGRLVIGTSDGHLLLLDAETGIVNQQIGQLPEEVCSVRFGPGGDLVTFAARDVADHAEIGTWRLGGAEEIIRHPIDVVRRVHDVAISPDGRLAACLCGPDVVVVDVETGTELGVLAGHEPFARVAEFSGDSRYVATGDGRGDEPARLMLWETAGWRRVALVDPHGGAVLDAGFADGNRIFLSATDSTGDVYAWQVPDGTLALVLKGLRWPVQMLSTGLGGRTIAAVDESGAIAIWEIPDAR
jgi:WD40 repeat protein